MLYQITTYITAVTNYSQCKVSETDGALEQIKMGIGQINETKTDIAANTVY
jgi:hypothetical protein